MLVSVNKKFKQLDGHVFMVYLTGGEGGWNLWILFTLKSNCWLEEWRIL